MSDVGVVRLLPSEERGTAGTAVGCCRVVAEELGSLVHELPVEDRLVVHRSQTQILVICHDQDDVGSLAA